MQNKFLSYQCVNKFKKKGGHGRHKKILQGCALQSHLASQQHHLHPSNYLHVEPVDTDEEDAETHDNESTTEGALNWPVCETTTFGNIRRGPDGDTLLPPGMFENLIQRARSDDQLAQEVMLVKDKLIRHSRMSDSCVYEPNHFRQLCLDAGAPHIFQAIRCMMSSTRRKERRESLIDKLTVNVIHTLCFGRSQKCNFMQKDFSIFLRSENLNRPALNTARRLGVTCTSTTERVHEARLIANYEHEIGEVIQNAIQNRHFVIAIIDDFTTIHSHRRPDSDRTSDAKCMCTVVIRVFPSIPAISICEGNTHLDPNIVLPDALASELTSDKYFYPLSFTYASTMSDAMTSLFFNPETVRQRLETHQYKESDNVREMRRLDNLYLLDFQECRLKNIEDYRRALTLLFSAEIREYAANHVLFVLGDWPTQYYLRQIVYQQLGHQNASLLIDEVSVSASSDHLYGMSITQSSYPTVQSHQATTQDQPTTDDQQSLESRNPLPLLSIIPVLGSLHISLNSQENVLTMYHPFMKFLYEQIFPHSKLADKPMPWRRTLILELVYGGWTLIRTAVITTFASCRDLEYGALLNLLDNYLPLVLAIYSVVFKSNKFLDYFNSVIRVWAMFYCFNRRHYDKAPLIWLSNVLYWQKYRPDIF